MSTSFRNSAAFGKRIEYWLVGLMMKEGLDVYLPLVDDDGIDAVVRRDDQSFTTVQIKARSKTCILGNGALFAGLSHEDRDNYWFIFYSERSDLIWIMTSTEFIKEANQNRSGKNAGKRTLKLNGIRKSPETGEREEYCLPRFEHYLATNFNRLIEDYPNNQ